MVGEFINISKVWIRVSTRLRCVDRRTKSFALEEGIKPGLNYPFNFDPAKRVAAWFWLDMPSMINHWHSPQFKLNLDGSSEKMKWCQSALTPSWSFAFVYYWFTRRARPRFVLLEKIHESSKKHDRQRQCSQSPRLARAQFINQSAPGMDWGGRLAPKLEKFHKILRKFYLILSDF